jgi:hypothetical protein
MVTARHAEMPEYLHRISAKTLNAKVTYLFYVPLNAVSCHILAFRHNEIMPQDF